MQRLGSAFAVSALAVLAAAPSAFADVSAAEVWAQWQDYAARSGQTVTVDSQSAAAGTLTLSGVTFAVEGEGETAEISLDSMVLHENGDGTVSIALPASIPVQLTTIEDGVTLQMRLQLDQQGLELTASGTAAAMVYDYAAERLTLELTDLQMGDDGSGEAPPRVAGNLTFEGVEGASRLGSGEPLPVDSALRADRVGFALDISAETEPTTVAMRGELGEVVATSASLMPQMGVAASDLPAALRAGMTVSGSVTYGPAEFRMDVRSPTDDLAAGSSVDGGTLGFQLTKSGLRWNSGSQGLTVEASGSALPVPKVAFSLAETGFGLAMPLERSAAPEDVGLLLRLKSLDLDEGLWALLDPLGRLPHDPLTLVLDLTGKATLLVDLLSEEVQGGMVEMPAPPGLLHSLDLNELELTGAGASVTAEGAVTFDNDAPTDWDGVPAMEGALDITIAGATRLVDNLVAAGLMPEGQSMMAKMMLGQFTRPTGEPDTVTTRIELEKDGGITANGQRLQ